MKWQINFGFLTLQKDRECKTLMIKTEKGVNKNSVKKTSAIVLTFLLIFQVQAPLLFSADPVKIFKPIKLISTPTTTTSAITPVATTSTTSIAPISNTTQFLSVSPITAIAPIQTLDTTAAIGSITTTINPIDGPATILPIQQISLNNVTAIQPVDATAAIGSVSTTINADDGTTSVLPTVVPAVQSFNPPTTTPAPQVFDNTSGATPVFQPFSTPSEEEGQQINADNDIPDVETSEFFLPDGQSNNNSDGDSNNNPPDNNTTPPTPPVNPTNTPNSNPSNSFVPTQQNNTGGGGGGASSGGVTLGDGRSPQPTVLNTKLGDLVGGGVLGISEKLARYLGNQKNKDKKNKKKNLKKKKITQGKGEQTDQEEMPSEGDATMKLVVDGQEIEVGAGQRGQNKAELKAQETLKPILKEIQKDELKIDVVPDVTPAFSFQANAFSVVSKPVTPKQSIRGIDEAKQTFIANRKFKTSRLAKRISLPVQFQKIHKIHSIATQEGTFINEFNTGADPDYVFPGE